MANKAKAAYGSRNGVKDAIEAGTIDAFDILFLSGEGEKPVVGWIDKDKNPIIPEVDTTDLENHVSELESEVAKKANADEVNLRINEVEQNTMSTANTYIDERLEAVLGDYLAKKYEISHKPEGTLVNYRDKEIRIMCPTDVKWKLQDSGNGADSNRYYIGFKAYAPENAANFKEDLSEIIVDDTMYTFDNNEFAGIDEQGRKYSIVWLPVAAYDEANKSWSYFGAKSTTDKYVGWYYSVEWYDVNGVLVVSDCIKINLSNENCHASIEPFYMSNAIKTANTYTDEQIQAKISEMSGLEIIEF